MMLLSFGPDQCFEDKFAFDAEPHPSRERAGEMSRELGGRS